MTYLVSSNATDVKRVKIPLVLLILVTLVVVAGAIGVARSVYFAGSYAYARFGLYDTRKNNEKLNLILKFQSKRVAELKKSSMELAKYENSSRQKLGINEIDENVRLAGVGGPQNLDQIISASFAEPSVMKAINLENDVEVLLHQVAIQDSTFDRFSDFAKRQHDKWAQRPSIWPLRGRITSPFGYRIHPILGIRMFHSGIDIANALWTPVFATADGVCFFSGSNGDYGNAVKLKHMNGTYMTIYAHLVKTAVVEGEVVHRGEVVGYLGNTGRSTGPHCHYEIRKLNKAINPMNYILPLDVVID